ncbi:Gfo/Idh/MocA family protein [Sandaracinobacteroides saxicola]|nr:Gfo/Idh/MocA family oxidoreductase [Sandaracinobacteroides saxicola]
MNIALLGYGKIAADSHVPAIAATPGVTLAAVISRRGEGPPGVPVFPSLAALAESGLSVDAISLANRPAERFATAMEALARGWHVMLEKPPAATVAQAEALVAAAGPLTLFATWHARENAAVDAARELLRTRTITAVRIVWREDVNKWHPGQDWVWQPGGFGVFDPGINALSILTSLVPGDTRMQSAHLIRPPGKPMPIIATLDFSQAGIPVHAHFDWSPVATETWDIAFDTREGPLLLSNGGATLHVDGTLVETPHLPEYQRLYARFAALEKAGASDADLSPLIIVEAAFAAAP